MHEWALAEAVIAAAKQIAEKEGLKQVTEVVVKMGELQDVEHEIFRFALAQLKAGILKEAKFKVSTAKSTLKCRVCGNIWEFDKQNLDEQTAEAIHFVPEVAHTYIKCPKCNSPDFEIAQGRGVWLDSIKGAR
ncbi:MAG: hydrogenase nickel incorporation protein HypA [Candidatus Bathyarchaeota archaeon]|nr:hydrogenase nickel incorporation protein HypA [Candidatus Bathyarchaeota archaeon]